MSEVNPQYTDTNTDDALKIIRCIKANYGKFESKFGSLPRNHGATKHAVALYACGYIPSEDGPVPLRFIDPEHVHDEFPGMERRTFRYVEIFRQSGYVGFSLLDAYRDRSNMMHRTDVFGLPTDTSRILTLNESRNGLQLGGINFELAKMVDDVFPVEQRVVGVFRTIFEGICSAANVEFNEPPQN